MTRVRSPEELARMPAGQLRKYADRFAVASSENCKALIAAGRGNETGRETRAKSDPLSLEYVAVNDAWSAATAEQAARRRYHGGDGPILSPKTHI